MILFQCFQQLYFFSHLKYLFFQYGVLTTNTIKVYHRTYIFKSAEICLHRSLEKNSKIVFETSQCQTQVEFIKLIKTALHVNPYKNS